MWYILDRPFVNIESSIKKLFELLDTSENEFERVKEIERAICVEKRVRRKGFKNPFLLFKRSI